MAPWLSGVALAIVVVELTCCAVTTVSIVILAVIACVIAASIAFTVIEYEALIAYGDARSGNPRADVRAVDDASLLVYLEYRRRWRWWFKLRARITRMIERLRHEEPGPKVG